MFRLALFCLVFCSACVHAADPVLSRVALFGDSGTVSVQAVALDGDGNVYIGGTTTGDIPLLNAVQGTPGKGNCYWSIYKGFARCEDLFVAKFDPTGTKLLYSTYLGTDDRDLFAGMAVDRDGSVVVTGTTSPTGACRLFELSRPCNCDQVGRGRPRDCLPAFVRLGGRGQSGCLGLPWQRLCRRSAIRT